MKKTILTFLTAFYLTLSFGQFKTQGSFIGLEPMKNYSDPSKPNYKWYHLSVLTFQGDSVFLEQSPVAIYKKDTVFSASDGGFYYYVGTIEKYQGKTISDMTLKSCDYCPNQFIKFIPPKLVKDLDTTQATNSDTVTTLSEHPMIENTSIKFKIMFLEKTKSTNTILVDKNIYRRQKEK
jgi:hypothetical protein